MGALANSAELVMIKPSGQDFFFYKPHRGFPSAPASKTMHPVDTGKTYNHSSCVIHWLFRRRNSLLSPPVLPLGKTCADASAASTGSHCRTSLHAAPLTVTGGITLLHVEHYLRRDSCSGLRLQPHKGNLDWHSGRLLALRTSRLRLLRTRVFRSWNFTVEFNIQVIEGITVNWQEAPAVHGNKLSGSAVVSNQTGDEFVLTVIVVAVNQIGRATALGYQHLQNPGR